MRSVWKFFTGIFLFVLAFLNPLKAFNNLRDRLSDSLKQGIFFKKPEGLAASVSDPGNGGGGNNTSTNAVKPADLPIVTIISNSSNSKGTYTFDLTALADISQQKGFLKIKTFHGLLRIEIKNEKSEVIYNEPFNEYGHIEALVNLSKQPVGTYTINYKTPIRTLTEIIKVSEE